MSTSPAKKRGIFYGYIVVAAAFVIFACIDGGMHSFGVFLKPLVAEFGWSRAMTSGAYSLFLLVLGFSFMATGRLSDKFGPRIVLSVCGFLFGLGYILMTLLHSAWQFYLFYGVITALGMSGGFVPLASTVARWFVKGRGLMTGLAVSGIGVGIVVAPPLASQVIVVSGWRMSYLALGITTLVLIVASAQFLRKEPAEKGLLPYGQSDNGAENLSTEEAGASFFQAVRTGQFWILGIIFFCFGFDLILILSHIVPHATDIGISPVAAASILAIIGGISMAGRTGMGVVCDRIGCKPSLIISFIVYTLSFAWLFFARDLWMFWLFAVIFGLAYGGLVTLMSTAIVELFGMKAHGAILGTIDCIHCIGAAAGPLVGGYIFDVTASYQFAFVLTLVVSLVGLALSALLTPVRDFSISLAKLAINKN